MTAAGLPPRPGERGAALVVVLWITLAIALLAAALSRGIRLETHRLANRVAAAEARAAVEAGFAHAAMGLLSPVDRRWTGDGRVHAVQDGAARLDIRVWDDTGRLDLNRAPPERLRRILAGVLDGARAEALVRRILAARTPGPITDPAALAAAAGLDRAAWARLARLTTVHNGLPAEGVAARAAPDGLLRLWPGLAPLDRRALLAARDRPGTPLPAGLAARLAALGLQDGPPGEVFTVRVTATTLAARASAEALVWLHAGAGQAYRILEWREPAEADDEEPAATAEGEGGSP
jgi:hypothetical protein